jgi:hypothetical protein
VIGSHARVICGKVEVKGNSGLVEGPGKAAVEPNVCCRLESMNDEISMEGGPSSLRWASGYRLASHSLSLDLLSSYRNVSLGTRGSKWPLNRGTLKQTSILGLSNKHD